MRSVLITQAVLAVAVAIGFYFLKGFPAVQAALYGGAIALLNTFLLARRVKRAGDVAQEDANRGTVTLYIGAVQRFVIALAGFAIGMGLLKLAPLPQLLAFAAAQAAYLLEGARGAAH
jgi:ATP synthase protein I